jgi:hypothetical protein
MSDSFATALFAAQSADAQRYRKLDVLFYSINRLLYHKPLPVCTHSQLDLPCYGATCTDAKAAAFHWLTQQLETAGIKLTDHGLRSEVVKWLLDLPVGNFVFDIACRLDLIHTNLLTNDKSPNAVLDALVLRSVLHRAHLRRLHAYKVGNLTLQRFDFSILSRQAFGVPYPMYNVADFASQFYSRPTAIDKLPLYLAFMEAVKMMAMLYKITQTQGQLNTYLILCMCGFNLDPVLNGYLKKWSNVVTKLRELASAKMLVDVSSSNNKKRKQVS